jgi:hypothetical protein
MILPWLVALPVVVPDKSPPDHSFEAGNTYHLLSRSGNKNKKAEGRPLNRDWPSAFMLFRTGFLRFNCCFQRRYAFCFG